MKKSRRMWMSRSWRLAGRWATSSRCCSRGSHPADAAGTGREHTLFVHVTLVPFIAAAQELKTKPTQHSVKESLSIGIQPDILLCRHLDCFLAKDIKVEDCAVLGCCR